MVISPTESMRSSRLGSIAPSVRSGHSAVSAASLTIAPGLAALATKKRQEQAEEAQAKAAAAAERERLIVEAELEKTRKEQEDYQRKQQEIMQKAAEAETRKNLIDAAKAIAAEAGVTEDTTDKEADTPQLVIDLDAEDQDEPKVVSVMAHATFPN